MQGIRVLIRKQVLAEVCTNLGPLSLMTSTDLFSFQMVLIALALFSG